MDFSFKAKKLPRSMNGSDIKGFLESRHGFYENKNPEMDIIARKFHNDYSLEEFYRVFNRMWNSGIERDRTIGLKTIFLYKNDYNFNTWRFFALKIKEINEIDLADRIARNVFG